MKYCVSRSRWSAGQFINETKATRGGQPVANALDFAWTLGGVQPGEVGVPMPAARALKPSRYSISMRLKRET